MKFDGAAFKKLERLNVGIRDFLPFENKDKALEIKVGLSATMRYGWEPR